jgi:hypothetical protein
VTRGFWATKLGAPEFSNEAIYKLANFYEFEYLDASTVRYVYSNTVPGSKLRNFMADHMKFHGPFSKKTTVDWEADTLQRHETEWTDLLAEGGDIIKDVIKTVFINLKTSTRHDREKIYESISRLSSIGLEMMLGLGMKRRCR